MTVYQLVKWMRIDWAPKEETVAFYESYKDATLKMRELEFNSGGYDYHVYTCRVIPSSEHK